MTADDRPRFLQCLSSLAEMFSDELLPSKQKLYWQLFADRSTLAEWEYACFEAMSHETFHKVPLPAALWEYIRGYRAEQQRLQALDAARERDAARLVAHAERLALEASPEWQAEQAKQRAEDERRLEEYQEWLAQQPRSVKIALRLINPPNPARWLPLSEDELAYEPTEDPATAKARLRQQLRQLMDEGS